MRATEEGRRDRDTMLLLLSLPRGRISAARVAARAREHGDAEARRVVARPPSAPFTPECPPPALPAHGRDDQHG